MCSITVFTLPQTGIRDPDLIDNTEKSFLGPLRSTLIRWLEDPTIAAGTIKNLLFIWFANCSYLGMAKIRTKVFHLRHSKPTLRGLTKH